jgi:glycosyltransferase involved in cell wall biosynthesis
LRFSVIGGTYPERVLRIVTPYGRQGPSSRVRVFEWLDRIPEHVEVSSYVSHRSSSPRHLLAHPSAVVAAERRLRAFAAAEDDPLLLHREASPLSRGGLERRLLTRRGPTVYDFDDALQWDTGGGRAYRRLAPKSLKALVAVQTADRVVAGNRVLAEWASSYNDDVRVIPSCVDPAAYRRKTDYVLRDPPRLGWIGSVDNEVYLQTIASVLLELHRRTGARLTLIGTTNPRLGPLEAIIDRVAWSEAAAHDRLAEFDIGLAPTPDEPYERGKSGYKLLQYAAAGVPLVASPVGVNRDLVDRFAMPGASTPVEFHDAIAGLLELSAAARSVLAGGARAVVDEAYSYTAWIGSWRTAVGLDP